MDHEQGKDPTPQGRRPGKDYKPDLPEPASQDDAKYASSAPGPAAMADGAAFFGYKRENAHPKRPTTQP